MKNVDIELDPAAETSAGNRRPIINSVHRLLCSFPPVRVRSFGRDSLFLRPREIIGGEFIEIGERTHIGRGTSLHTLRDENITDIPQLIIGNDVMITANAWITCANRITIGNGCVLSRYVYVTDVEHGYDSSAGPLLKQRLTSKGPVEIQENTFVGYGACILPGVTLGKNCVVGTRSVVTRSFPDYSMVVGTPARVIKTYSLEKRQWVSVE